MRENVIHGSGDRQTAVEDERKEEEEAEEGAAAVASAKAVEGVHAEAILLPMSDALRGTLSLTLPPLTLSAHTRCPSASRTRTSTRD